MTWYYLSEKEPLKLAQLVTGPGGNFVRIFKPDGALAMLDATLRNIDTIKRLIRQPSLSL